MPLSVETPAPVSATHGWCVADQLGECGRRHRADRRVAPWTAFRFATDVRVRFAETDAQGVAHNAAYLVWFEVARVDYLEAPRGRLPGAPGARRSRRS